MTQKTYKLGEDFYIISPISDEAIVKPGWSGRTDLVVLAHGAEAGGATLTVPKGKELLFYVQHGKLLDVNTQKHTAADADVKINYSVLAAMDGAAEVRERFDHGTTPRPKNYGLKRFTEASLKSTQATVRHRTDSAADVLVVRNRRLRPDPTVSDLLRALADKGHKYARIHCVFCRPSTKTAKAETKCKGDNPMLARSRWPVDEHNTPWRPEVREIIEIKSRAEPPLILDPLPVVDMEIKQSTESA